MPSQLQAGDLLRAAPWAELLARRCGVSLRPLQVPTFVDLLRARMQVRSVESATAYYDLLEAEADSGTEWTALVERLVSKETSFFRHLPSFDMLRTRLLPALRRRPDVGTRHLALLSAGCSTGQEAYSLAMIAMADPEVRGAFVVSGIDISRPAIEIARRGRYTARAAASVPAWCRERFLRAIGDGRRGEYEIADQLRQRVRFAAMNLYTACRMFLNYDVIFCQNVLIYFAPSAATQLVALLGARLSLGGYLVAGPGEAPVDPVPGLEAVSIDGVRVFRRLGRTTREVRQ